MSDNNRIKLPALADAADTLQKALADYHSEPGETAGASARNMIGSFAQFFRRALPAARNEIIAALVELCAVECGRARLELLKRTGHLPKANIISINDMLGNPE